MIFLYCFVGIIPIVIILHCFKTLDKRIRKNRLKHAIISVLNIIYDIIIIVLVLQKKVSCDFNNYWVTIGPFIFCLLSFISYEIGNKKDRKIQADIIAEQSYDIMDLRNNGRRAVNISVSSDQ